MAVNKAELNAAAGLEKLVQEIIYIGILINTHTEFCVFIHFSGHVENLSIKIGRSKENWGDTVVDSGDYINRIGEGRLLSIKEKLLEILESKEVDVSKLRYEIEEVKHYKL